MEYNKDYFQLDLERDTKYAPLHYTPGTWGDPGDVFDNKALDDTVVRYLSMFLEYQPDSNELADFHKMGFSQNLVVSERVANVLKSFNLKNVQFFPAVITDDNGVQHHGYSIIHVFNSFNDEYYWVIKNNPLEERLVFLNKADVLYHRTVVEKLLEIQPTGMRVVEIFEKWNPEMESKEDYLKRLLAFDDE